MTTIRNLILVLAVLNWIFAAEGVADMTHNGFSRSPLENRINFSPWAFHDKYNSLSTLCDWIRNNIPSSI